MDIGVDVVDELMQSKSEYETASVCTRCSVETHSNRQAVEYGTAVPYR